MSLCFTYHSSVNAKTTFCLSSLNQRKEKVMDWTIEESELKSQPVQTTLFLAQCSYQIWAEVHW